MKRGFFSSYFSFHTRITIALALMGIFSAGFLAVFGFFHERHHLYELTEKHFNAINQTESLRFQMLLRQFREYLLLAAAMPRVQELIRAKDNGGVDPESSSTESQCLQRLELIFSAMSKNSGRYVKIAMLDQTGREMVRVDWNGKEPTAAPAQALQSKEDRPYFQETKKLAEGQVYISEPDMMQENGTFFIPYLSVIRIATPLFNQVNEFRGILIINLDADLIIHRAFPILTDENDNYRTFLATRNGFYIHHSSDPDQEWGGPDHLDTGHSLWNDYPLETKTILSGTSDGVENGPWEIFFTPVPLLSDADTGNFLVLGTLVRHDLILSASNHFIDVFSAAMIPIIGLAIVSAIFLSRRIIAPLNALRSGSRLIASGKLDHRIQFKGSLEFDELALDFNEMAAMLEAFYRSLQAEYQHLFDNTNDAIVIHDLTGRILNINETAIRRLGYCREELLTKNFQELSTVEEAHQIDTTLTSICEKGAAVFESKHQHKDGSVFPVEISSTILSYRGKPGIQSVVRDISERKQTEAGLFAALTQNSQLYELVLQEKRYAESVIQSISDGVVTMDTNRVILSWNNGAEKITGFGMQEVLGQSCCKILAHQDEAGRLFCGTEHCPASKALDTSGSEQAVSVFIRSKDGRLIPISIAMSPIVDGSGLNIGSVEVFRDVSKEAELIYNIQQVSQAKSNFLASMSHELRTPLNAILGFSDVLLEEYFGPLNDKQREYVSDVLSSGNHLLLLINDILYFSKIEAGKMELELGRFRIMDILENSMLMVRTKAIEHGIHLNMDIPQEMESFQIEVDNGKLKQVLYNLLSNAIKFTPDGGSIALKARFSDPSSKKLQITVEDTGIGINPDLMANLFEEFYQIQNVVNKTSGTGLGLSISLKIIRMHGGDIQVESEGLGYGSRFIIEIPCRLTL